jgi:acyl carrier protein phosphodiesterase
MFWDHCLARHWQAFHHSSLADFCRHAQARMEEEGKQEKNSLPPRFEKVAQSVWQGRWLECYAEIENINVGLQRMASRSPRMVPLADTGQTLLAHYELLSEQFFELYPDVLQKTSEFITGS